MHHKIRLYICCCCDKSCMSIIKVYSKLREITPEGQKLRGEEGKRLGTHIPCPFILVPQYKPTWRLCLPLSSSPPHPFRQRHPYHIIVNDDLYFSNSHQPSPFRPRASRGFRLFHRTLHYCLIYCRQISIAASSRIPCNFLEKRLFYEVMRQKQPVNS